MTSILHGLFNGSIIPWDRRDQDNPRQHEIDRQIEEEQRYFMEKMSLDDCQRLQKLSQLYLELSSTEEDNIFAYGFSLGLLLMLEVSQQGRLITQESFS